MSKLRNFNRINGLFEPILQKPDEFWGGVIMAYRYPIVEEVWKSREVLLEQHGGLEGFLRYIRKQEQEHSEKLVDPKQAKDAKDKRFVLR